MENRWTVFCISHILSLMICRRTNERTNSTTCIMHGNESFLKCSDCNKHLCYYCVAENIHRVHRFRNNPALLNQILSDRIALLSAPDSVPPFKLQDLHIALRNLKFHRDCENRLTGICFGMTASSFSQFESQMKMRCRHQQLELEFQLWREGTLELYGTPINQTIYRYNLPVTINIPETLTVTFGQDILNKPWGVACNHVGQYIVPDRLNHNVKVYDHTGGFLYLFGEKGSSAGQFFRPIDVAVRQDGLLVVTDKDNHRCQVLTTKGDLLFAFGRRGTLPGEFLYPWGVASNQSNQMVVADSHNNRIQLFSPDGEYLSHFGDIHNTVFEYPRGVCFTPSGDILVTYFNTECVVLLDRNLGYKKTMGMPGPGIGQFNRPQGIVCDDMGNFAVTDKHNRVQIFTPDNRCKYVIGQSGTPALDLNGPGGVAITVYGRIAVVDQINNRVQVYG